MDEDGKTPDKKFSCVVPNMSKGLTHLGLPYIFPRGSPTGGYSRDTHMGTKGKYCSLNCTLPVPHRISGFSIKDQN